MQGAGPIRGRPLFLVTDPTGPTMPSAPRLSTPADVAALHRVWRASVDATHDFIDPADIAFYEKLLLKHYLPQAPLWLATDEGGNIQGFIGLTGPKIDALFVHPANHRQGVGKRLIDHALSLHRQLLVDVNSDNAGALEFYRAMGFREVGHSPVDHTGKRYPLTFMARL